MFKEEQNATKRHTGVRTSNRKAGPVSLSLSKKNRCEGPRFEKEKFDL
jgi:hypothetical protein